MGLFDILKNDINSKVERIKRRGELTYNELKKDDNLKNYIASNAELSYMFVQSESIAQNLDKFDNNYLTTIIYRVTQKYEIDETILKFVLANQTRLNITTNIGSFICTRLIESKLVADYLNEFNNIFIQAMLISKNLNNTSQLILSNKELLCPIIQNNSDLCYKFIASSEMLEHLQEFNDDFMYNLMSQLILNYHNDETAMKFVLQNYERVPEVIHSSEFISLINTETLPEIKDVLVDYCKKHDGAVHIVESDNFIQLVNTETFDLVADILNAYYQTRKMSLNMRKAVKALGQDVDFFYGRQDVGGLYGKAVGLNVATYDAETIHDNIAEQIRKNDEYYKKHGSDPIVTLDKLCAIRAQKNFPLDATIQPASHSSAITTTSIAPDAIKDKIYEQIAKEYNLNDENDKDNLFQNHQPPEAYKKYNSLRNKYEPLTVEVTRMSTHFALNALVGEHEQGSAWQSMPVILLEPLAPHLKDFANLKSEDSWTFKDLELTGSIIVKEPHLKQLLEIAQTNESVKQTLKKCEIIVMPMVDNLTAEQFVQGVLIAKGYPAVKCHAHGASPLRTNADSISFYDPIDKSLEQLDIGTDISRIAEFQTPTYGIDNKVATSYNELRSICTFTKYFAKVKCPEAEQQVVGNLIEDAQSKAKELMDEANKLFENNEATYSQLEHIGDVEIERIKSNVSEKFNELIISSQCTLEEYNQLRELFNEMYKKYILGKKLQQTVYLNPSVEVDTNKIKKYRAHVKEMKQLHRGKVKGEHRYHVASFDTFYSR